MTDNTQYPAGTLLVFTGYTSLDPNEEALLEENETVKVLGPGKDPDVLAVQSVKTGKTDTLFDDEYELAEDQSDSLPKVTTKMKVAEIEKIASAEGIDLQACSNNAERVANIEAARAGEDLPHVLEIIDVDVEEVEAEEAVELTEDEQDEESSPTKIVPLKDRLPEPNRPAAEAEITDTPRVKGLLSNRPATDAATELSTESEALFYTLGGVLGHVSREKLQEPIQDAEGHPLYYGVGSFRRYVEEELSVSYRKARWLISIYETFAPLGVTEEQAAEIGWTKLRAMLPVVNEDNLEDLMEFAKDHNRAELEEKIQTEYVDAGTEDTKVKKVTATFAFIEADYDVVESAIEAAQSELDGDPTKSEGIMLICSEWGTLTQNFDQPLDVAIEQLEKRYGVTLQVVKGERTGDEEEAEIEVELETA